MPRPPIAVLLIVLLLLPLAAIPAQALVPPGRITVYSSPSGAGVCVDNTDCGTTTSTFTAAGNAWHTVVVTEKGYLQWSDTVYVIADQTTVVNAALELNPATTAIQVFVTPGGGTVCIDNSQCRVGVGSADGTGSVQFPGLSAGYHTITVDSLPGWEDATEVALVNPGEITTVQIRLDPVVTTTPVPESHTGSIRVYVNRAGSTVCIDNTGCRDDVGGGPGPGTVSAVFDDITAGAVHAVSVDADGFAPYSTVVPVSEDLVTTVDVVLQPAPDETTVPPASPAPTLTLPVETTAPSPTRAPSGLLPVLGALALCGAIVRLSPRE